MAETTDAAPSKVIAGCGQCSRTCNHARTVGRDGIARFECASCGNMARVEELRESDGRINRRERPDIR